nr:yypothetical protein Ycf2 [Hydnora abyssinica]
MKNITKLNHIKNLLRLLSLEIQDLVREFFSLNLMKFLKILNKLRKLILVLIMYFIILIYVFKSYFVSTLNSIKYSLFPLTYQCQSIMNNVDNVTSEMYQTLSKTADEESKLDKITLNLLQAMYTNLEKTRLNHKLSRLKKSIKLKKKYKVEFETIEVNVKKTEEKKIFEITSDQIRPFIGPSTFDLENKSMGGISFDIKFISHKWSGEIDYSDSYVSITTPNNPIFLKFRFGVLYQKLKNRFNLRKKKENKFSSLSFRFFALTTEIHNKNNEIESQFQHPLLQNKFNFYIKWSDILIKSKLFVNIEKQKSLSFSNYKINIIKHFILVKNQFIQNKPVSIFLKVDKKFKKEHFNFIIGLIRSNNDLFFLKKKKKINLFKDLINIILTLYNYKININSLYEKIQKYTKDFNNYIKTSKFYINVFNSFKYMASINFIHIHIYIKYFF